MSQEDQNLPVLQAMQGGVLTSSRYEYMFWVMAWRQERWPA